MKCRQRKWCIYYFKTISINSVIIIATNSAGIPIVFPFFKRNRDHIFIISCGNHLKVHKSKNVVVVFSKNLSIIMDMISWELNSSKIFPLPGKTWVSTHLWPKYRNSFKSFVILSAFFWSIYMLLFDYWGKENSF